VSTAGHPKTPARRVRATGEPVALQQAPARGPVGALLSVASTTPGVLRDGHPGCRGDHARRRRHGVAAGFEISHGTPEPLGPAHAAAC